MPWKSPDDRREIIWQFLAARYPSGKRYTWPTWISSKVICCTMELRLSSWPHPNARFLSPDIFVPQFRFRISQISPVSKTPIEPSSGVHFQCVTRILTHLQCYYHWQQSIEFINWSALLTYVTIFHLQNPYPYIIYWGAWTLIYEKLILHYDKGLRYLALINPT
jgi:hypothetical protein